MKKKTKLLFTILQSLTLALPLITYLILSATYFNIDNKYELKAKEYEVVFYEENAFIYSNELDVEYYGKVVYNEELNTFGFMLELEDIIKIDKHFLIFEIKEEKLGLNDVKLLEKREQQGWKIPLAIFIGIGGTILIALIVFKKMDLIKKYKEWAVLLSLALGTGILYLIDLIVSNLLMVFLIATASWFVFMIERGIVKFKNGNNITEEKKSLVLKKLEDALR